MTEIIEDSLRALLHVQRPVESLDFSAILTLLEDLAQRSPSEEKEATLRARLEVAPVNLQRTRRVLKTYTVPDDVRSTLLSIRQAQFWIVLTEPWCGDSAQILPYLVNLAECTPNIHLRFLLREGNPDIMDRYLTDGTRGIPKLIALDAGGSGLFLWGPRPKEGQEIFLKGIREGLPKVEVLRRLHLWYARRGMGAIESEIVALVRQSVLP